VITEQNGKLQVHLVQEVGKPTEQQMRSGEYIQSGNKFFHDLAKPTDVDKTKGDKLERDKEQQQQAEKEQRLQESVKTLMSDPTFAKSGRVSEETARAFSASLAGHDREMTQYIQRVNGVRPTADVVEIESEC
jgi:uncharacterized protein YaiL (DUF2058 family)